MNARVRAYSATIKTSVEAFCNARGPFTEIQIALRESGEVPSRMEDFESLIRNFNSVDKPRLGVG